MVEYVEVVLMYVGSKLRCVFIFMKFRGFFLPMFIYLDQWSVTFHTHGYEMGI